MIKPYQHLAKYYETDQMGIIHHSNYIRWFEEARIDYMNQIGLTYKKMEDEGIISPVLEVNCQYLNMMYFDDLATIKVKVTDYTGVRFAFEYEIYNQNNKLCTTGTSRHCFMTRDGKPVSLKRTKPEFDQFSGEAFSRLLRIPSDSTKYILAEEVILHFVSEIFSRYKVKSKSLIRITRNADIDEETVYDEDLDYRSTMKKLIKKRKKLSPVRMEMSRKLNTSALETLCKYIDLDKKYIFYSKSPLEFSFSREIQDILREHSELVYNRLVPQKSPHITSSRPIMEQIDEEDKLLFYPYNSMKPFLDMLYEASEDPSVVSIKMTLYRLANNSKIVEALTNAVENNKEVVVLVELRARFDEENNINWRQHISRT